MNILTPKASKKLASISTYLCIGERTIFGEWAKNFGESLGNLTVKGRSHQAPAHAAGEMPPTAPTRPYRSSKRNKPCDRCRGNKTKCQVVVGPSCAKCQREGLQCSFSGKTQPAPRSIARSDGYQTPTSAIDGSGHEASPILPWSQSPLASAPASHVAHDTDRATSVLQVTPLIEQPEADIRINTQFSQTLEGMQGFSAQFFGASSESDPWLLRHCKFDDLGTHSFQNSQFRNAGGVPFAHKIPIHFMIDPNELYESAKEETRISDKQVASRQELDRIVPPECGQRLVALFVKFVFPMLPVISRSQLGITPGRSLPSWPALERYPLHLLGALYALALPFASDDEHLAIWSCQTSPSIDVLWRLVYEELQDAVHQPQLSTVQATLLYLHRTPQNESRYALSDTPFTWAWTGKLVGLATSLALNTEASMWAIPNWEKRLRKRLWWAVYAEDKWRSLLMGRPPYIHQQEWDVEELEAIHFAFSSSELVRDEQVPFRRFVELARIAEAVQETFYSLRASQNLSTDLTASVQAARLLLERLNHWRSSFTEQKVRTDDDSAAGSTKHHSSILFGHCILIVYVYRALLRPMVESTIPPHIIDLEEPIIDNSLAFDDFSWDAPDLESIMPFPVLDSTADSQAEIVEDITRAANECAMGMVNLVRRFSLGDFSSFWYSWARIGFAMTSNFITLLLVQAPNAQYASKAKQLLDVWGQMLKDQSRVCPILRLGMKSQWYFTYLLCPRAKTSQYEASSANIAGSSIGTIAFVSSITCESQTTTKNTTKRTETMHLTTGHTSSYYSALPKLNMTNSPPCLNMSMISRVARGIPKCVCLNGTNGTHYHANMASAHASFLHVRDIDSADSQGMHASAIAGIIFAVIVGIIFVGALLGWAVKSNRLAFETSGGRRGQTRRRGGPRGPSPLQKGTLRDISPEQKAYMRGSANAQAPAAMRGTNLTQEPPMRGTNPQAPGAARATGPQGSIRSPPRAHTAGPRFPGPRNGYGNANKPGRGPYADGSAFAATHAWESRNQDRAARAGYIV
ncbi:hypothetical protein Q7P37_002517 [Cladosporium fusiforme]